VQEKLFETAVPFDPMIRNRLAIFLHDHHPRTAHPPTVVHPPVPAKTEKAKRRKSPLQPPEE